MNRKGYLGSALSVGFFNQIIQNTKIKNPANEITNERGEIYKLDKNLSTRVVRVYYNEAKKHVIISHSSTIADFREAVQSFRDIWSDIYGFFFGNKTTN